MSQNEVEDEDIETTEASEVENIDEDITTSDEKITWEEIHDLRAKAKSLEKANKKIAFLEKGAGKKSKEEEPIKTLSEEDLDSLLDKRDFYKSTPTAKNLREEIEAMVSASKGKVTREKAHALLSGDAEIEENRKVYGNGTVLGSKSVEATLTPLSIDKYDSLSITEQDSYNKNMIKKFGKIKFK